MRRFLAALALVPSLALAAPSISSLSGTWTDGASITITGTNFGTKSPAAPLVWDNFEAGSAGSNISGWSTDVGGGCTETYSANPSGSGQVVKLHLPSNASCWRWKELASAQTQIYATYKLRIPSAGSGDHLKCSRIASAAGTGEERGPHNSPYVGFTYTPRSYWYVFNYFAGSQANEIPIGDNTPALDSWMREEYYFKVSTPDVADGYAYAWRNGKTYFAAAGNCPSANACMTLSSQSTGTTYQRFYLPYYIESGTKDVYADEVYVDNTPARVELCFESSAPDGSSLSHCEVQIPSAWSATSITVTAHLGSLSPASAYVYVVDSSQVWSNAKAAGSAPPPSSRRVNGAN